MGKRADDLLAKLHPANPYANFHYMEYTLDLQGGPEDTVLPRVIAELRPAVTIEVGCWKGGTAVRLASLLKAQGDDAVIVCVDTWLGSVEHWAGTVPGWDIRPYLKHGFPALYHQFLANVMHSRCEDVIVPVPNTSSIAARLLARQQVVADLVYIDGSHDEDDVYQDLLHYWKLLRPGGLLVGDDWHAYWYGVICAVNRFARERDLPLQVAGQKWLLRKPAGDGGIC
jgi:Methyltransferase domain